MHLHSNDIRPLYVNEIVSALNRLSTITGNGSRAARQSILVSLLRRCDCSKASPAATADSSVESILGTRPELRFLVRTMICNLRIHATNVTILSAVARACTAYHRKSNTVLEVPKETLQAAETAVRSAYARHHNLKSIVEALQIGGVKAVETVEIKPLIPVDPMLAKPASTISEVLKSAAGCNVLLEWKYDGVRAQLHIEGNKSAVFSRHLSDVTAKYSDALQLLRCASSPTIDSAIFDAEIVAVNKLGPDRKILRFKDYPRAHGKMWQLLRLM